MHSRFVSVERIERLTTPGKLLSLSVWEDEDAVTAWRRTARHRAAQAAGRGGYWPAIACGLRG